MMARYRSKPTEVEAIQWLGDNIDELVASPAVVATMHDPVWSDPDENGARYVTGTVPNGQLNLLAGKDGAQDWVPVPIGHWVVWNPDDLTDFWPVDPDYFAAKYEPADPRNGGTVKTVQCCCTWGDAVSGEWPEFECWDCPLHGNGLDDVPERRCKRHARAAAERGDDA